MRNNVLNDVHSLYKHTVLKMQHVIDKVSHFKVSLQWADDVSLISTFALDASCPFLAFSVDLKNLRISMQVACAPSCPFCFSSPLSCSFLCFLAPFLKKQESKEGKQKRND